MRFPVIRIRDNGSKEQTERIVGTNHHDVLYIDSESGGIHYLNIQCMAGTESDFEFIGTEPYFTGDCEIEMMEIEQLIEIAIAETEMDIARCKKVDELARKHRELREKMTTLTQSNEQLPRRPGI